MYRIHEWCVFSVYILLSRALCILWVVVVVHVSLEKKWEKIRGRWHINANSRWCMHGRVCVSIYVRECLRSNALLYMCACWFWCGPLRYTFNVFLFFFSYFLSFFFVFAFLLSSLSSRNRVHTLFFRFLRDLYTPPCDTIKTCVRVYKCCVLRSLVHTRSRTREAATRPHNLNDARNFSSKTTKNVLYIRFVAGSFSTTLVGRRRRRLGVLFFGARFDQFDFFFNFFFCFSCLFVWKLKKKNNNKRTECYVSIWKNYLLTKINFILF